MKKIKIISLLIIVSIVNACSTLNDSSLRRDLASTSCTETANRFITQINSPAPLKANASDEDIAEYAERLEDLFHNEFAEFRKAFILQMPTSTKVGEWSFRAKTAESITTKLKRKLKAEGEIKDLHHALILLGDGLGARILFTRMNKDPDNLESQFNHFVSEFSKMLKESRFKLLSIENYQSDEMGSYFSSKQIDVIVDAAKSSGSDPTVIDGQKAVRNTGYTSVHINVLLPNGLKAEIQIRDSILDQMAEVSHLFYDFVAGKPMPEKITSNNQLKKALDFFKTFSEIERAQYLKYLENNFEVIMDYVDNGAIERSKPDLTGRLLEMPEIKVEVIAEALGFKRVRDFLKKPTAFQEKDSYKSFNSTDYIADNYGLAIVKKVIGNVSQGDARNYHLLDIKPGIRQLEKDLSGLNYVAVIPWEESSYLKKRRAIIRTNRKDPSKPKFKGEIKLPKYQDGQYTGDAVVGIDKIHYMQDSADHDSGAYTVAGNAQALKNGTLKVTDLPALTVWKDESGKIWSLDHRRLAAFELSGVVKEVPVRFVTKEEVLGDNYKFSNADDGRSIIIQLDDDVLAYIIAKK